MFLETLQNSQENTLVGLSLLIKPARNQRLWHRCFPVNFAKLLRTPFLQNTSGRLLLSKTWLALQFSIFLVSSFIENLLLFITFQQKNEIKEENTLMEFKYLLFLSSIDLFAVKDFQRNFTAGNLIRKRVLKRFWYCNFHG